MKPSVNIPERLPSSSSGSILGNSSLLLLGDEGPAAVSASAPSSMDSSEDHRQLELVVGTGGQDAGTPAVVMLGRSLAEAGRGRSHSMDISLLREAEFGPLPAGGFSCVVCCEVTHSQFACCCWSNLAMFGVASRRVSMIGIESRAQLRFGTIQASLSGSNRNLRSDVLFRSSRCPHVAKPKEEGFES